MHNTPPAKTTPATNRPRPFLRRDDLVGFAFLAPFLAAYLTFLVVPFGRAVWTSFLDWNLLAVVFNPDARQFVGLDNWRDLLWGAGITWSPTIRPVTRILTLALTAWLALRALRGTLRPRTAIPAILALLLAALSSRTHPRRRRHLERRRFYGIVTNTLTSSHSPSPPSPSSHSSSPPPSTRPAHGQPPSAPPSSSARSSPSPSSP